MSIETAIIHKELDLIQDVVKRQATNSFQVKTWMMGIVTAILAFKNDEIFSAGKTPGHHGLWISLVLLLPIICFWYDLNTFKRKNYQTNGEPVEDLKAKAGSVWKVMFSVTLRTFYLIPLIFVLALAAYNLILK